MLRAVSMLPLASTMKPAPRCQTTVLGGQACLCARLTLFGNGQLRICLLYRCSRQCSFVPVVDKSKEILGLPIRIDLELIFLFEIFGFT